jgi:hypothetical protein
MKLISYEVSADFADLGLTFFWPLEGNILMLKSKNLSQSIFNVEAS